MTFRQATFRVAELDPEFEHGDYVMYIGTNGMLFEMLQEQSPVGYVVNDATIVRNSEHISGYMVRFKNASPRGFFDMAVAARDLVPSWPPGASS